MPTLDELTARIESAQKAEAARLAAWLPYDVCCGRLVEHFNLRHWATLVESGNRFLDTTGSIPLGGDIAQFLWIIQPRFDWLTKPDKRWLREVGKMDVGETVRQIAAYMERALYDVAGAAQEGSYAIEIAAFPAHYVHRFADLYGWTQQQILDTPIARLAQLDNIARVAGGDAAAYSSKLVALKAKKLAMERACQP